MTVVMDLLSLFASSWYALHQSLSGQYENEQLHSEVIMSSPSPNKLAIWRVFLECGYALIDILDAELQAEADMTLRWYDVLVNLEEAERPVRMNELAGRILASKSGLTRVIDRMEEAGLVERQRPRNDRRAIEVVLTQKGAEALRAARVVHRRGINEHFAQHLDDGDFASLLDALEPVHEHVRPLRPDRISEGPRGRLS
jgi:DNA-binding MarR family transcriptional regulator